MAYLNTPFRNVKEPVEDQAVQKPKYLATPFAGSKEDQDRSLWDEALEIGEREQEIPWTTKLKEYAATNLAFGAGAFLLDDPQTSIAKNAKASIGGMVRGATMGWLDPAPEEDMDTSFEKGFSMIGELVGFAAPIVAGQAPLKAAGLAGKGTGLFKTIVGESLLGAGMGATRKLEEDQKRLTAIATDAALFGGIGGTLRGIGKGVGLIKNMVTKGATETALANNTVKDIVASAAKTHGTFAETSHALSSFEIEDVAITALGLGKKEIKNTKSILFKVQSKTMRLAKLQNETFTEAGSIPGTVDSLKKSIIGIKNAAKDRNSLVPFATKRINKLSKDIRKLEKRRITLGKRKQQIGLLEKEIAELTGSPAYERALKVSKLGGKASDAVSPRGIAIDPVIAAQLIDTAPVSSRHASIFTALDPRRFAQIADKGDQNGLITRLFIRPVEAGFKAYTGEANIIRNEFSQKIVNANLTRPNVFAKTFNTKSYKSYQERMNRLFDFAEGKELSGAEMSKITPQEKEYVQYVKDKYADFLKRINDERKFLNLKEIKEREDYITHANNLSFMHKMGTLMSKEGAASGKGFIKTSNPVFKYAKERLGGEFEKDITTSFNSYLDPALRQIHMTRAGSQVKAYTGFLENYAKNMDNIMTSKKRKSLETVKTFFDDWVEESVFNSPTDIDKIVGPKIAGMLGSFASKTSAGAIVGNASTIALQPSTFLTTGALTSPRAMLEGWIATFSKEGRKFVTSNSFEKAVREVELDIPANELGNIAKGANWLNKVVDSYMVDHSFLSGYKWATRQGLSHDGAIRYADHVSTTAQATYNKLFTPKALRSQALKPAMQFQTFMFNLWNSIVADTKITAMREGNLAAAKRAGKIAGAMVATNVIWESAGIPAPYDFQLPVDIVDLIKDGEFKFVPKQTSFGGLIPVWGSVGKYGPPIAGKALKSISTLISNDDPDRKKQAIKELGKLSTLLVPGGNQIRKTTEGILAINRGYSKAGRKKIAIKDFGSEVQSILFGPSQTTETRAYYQRLKDRK